MIHASVAQLRHALDAREISSVELTELFLVRSETLNAQLNAFISIDREGALAAAAAADARIAAGQAGGLTGIPLAHQDALCTAGLLSSAGSKMLANFISPYDAHVVSLLKDAGTVLLGKTNMDEFGSSQFGMSSFYGACTNPWDQERLSGGSASGSAVAVAAGLTPLATALDSTGGLRQPAAWCGVTALRPSYGLLSRHGLIAYAPSFDQVSASAASAADCALLLQAMAGFDPRDATSFKRPAVDYAAALQAATGSKPLAGLRIALAETLFADAGAGVDPDTLQALQNALAVWRELGAELVQVELPSATHAVAASCALSCAEASTSLSRYDGIRFGHRAASYHDLDELYALSRSEGFGEAIKTELLFGTHILSQAGYQTLYLQAQRARRLLADELHAVLGEHTILLTPTMASNALSRNEFSGELSHRHQFDRFTSLASLAGLPALTLPAGFDRAGLPIGLQLIGPRFAEAALLQAADRFQQQTDWHQRRPSLGA